MKEIIRNWTISILGVIGASFSIVMSIKANLGLNSFNALLGNLSEATGITMGIFSWVSGVMFILMNMAVSKTKKFNWSAMVISFIFGLSIDFFFGLLNGSVLYEPLFLRIVIFFAMIVLAGISIGLLIYSGVNSSVEEYQFAIQTLFRTDVATAKIYADLSFFIFAVAVGLFAHNGLGQVQWGTLIVTLTTGRVIGYTLNILNRQPQKDLLKA